jgi:hypothetical protein
MSIGVAFDIFNPPSLVEARVSIPRPLPNDVGTVFGCATIHLRPYEATLAQIAFFRQWGMRPTLPSHCRHLLMHLGPVFKVLDGKMSFPSH